MTRWIDFFVPDTLNLLWLALSLFIAGVIEAFMWKTSLFQLLNIPIQAEWFGANKKWRGLFSLPIAMVISVCLLNILLERLDSYSCSTANLIF